MDMKEKIFVGVFLLIAFIGISVATGGITPLNNSFVLNQTHDFNGVTYHIVSADFDFVLNGFEVGISEFVGSKPIIFSGEMVENIFVYDSNELNQSIENILFVNCVNRGECELPEVEPQPIIVDADIGIFSQILMKSLIPNFENNYFEYFYMSDLNSKTTHYANIDQNYLGLEERVVALEGVVTLLLNELCLADNAHRFCDDVRKEDFVNNLINWSIGYAFNVGDYVSYNNNVYRVLQAHVSQGDWLPNNVPALYQLINLDEWGTPQIQEWVQPTGAHDCYELGAIVTYNGFTWENTGSNCNVYAPGVWGWTKV